MYGKIQHVEPLHEAYKGPRTSQMSYDTPMSGPGQELSKLPLKEQLRRGFKDMGTRSFSSAKNFGLIGTIFAGTECCIEGVSKVSLS